MTDPVVSDPFALGGRVATMDADRGSTVIPDGGVYVRDGTIAAVDRAAVAPPPGFESVPVVPTGGTILPGLIELHNHLPYDVLGLWNVPKTYGNRDEWSGPSTPDYHRLITGPMQVLGADEQVVTAVVRLVEVRCLLGGTTTSQGVTLATDPGIVKHFQGLVRNVEATGDPDLPNAATHIADVEAADRDKFLARISGSTKLILHLAEGTDSAAHDHFAALQDDQGNWAITDNLIGIHCVALTDSDFHVFATHGGSMVWSPLSNLLLYGRTADIVAARRHQLPIALGSDWSPSGSVNLLGELKVARAAASMAGAGLTDEDLVAMATCVPARMLGWDQQLGSIEVGRRADLIVVAGQAKPAHSTLVEATEADVELVVIEGIPRAGTPDLMTALGLFPGSEIVTVAGEPRVLNLTEATADPDLQAVSVSDAQELVGAAPANLPNHDVAAPAALPSGQMRLATSGLVDNQMSPRHHLSLAGNPTGPNQPLPGAGGPEQAVPVGLPALELQTLTAIDSPGYYALLAREMNLPQPVRNALAAFAPAPGP